MPGRTILLGAGAGLLVAVLTFNRVGVWAIALGLVVGFSFLGVVSLFSARRPR